MREALLLLAAIYSINLYMIAKIFPILFIFFFLRGVVCIAEIITRDIKIEYIKKISIIVSLISAMFAGFFLK